MKTLFATFCLLTLAANQTPAADQSTETNQVTFFVQIVRGTDRDQPEETSWNAAGPKITARLKPVFRWKQYWEVSRHELTLQPAKPVRATLSGERSIEIRWIDHRSSELRLYRNGDLVRRSRQEHQACMSIMGGDRGLGDSWFVVVRTDKPQ